MHSSILPSNLVRRLRLVLPAIVGLVAFNTVARGEDAPAPTFDTQALEFFENDVRPLLVKRCYECHGPDAKRLEGGLLMTSRAALLEGGDTGPAIISGNAKGSLLIDAINYGELYEMPPKGKLPAEEIAVLTKWVEMGAPVARCACAAACNIFSASGEMALSGDAALMTPALIVLASMPWVTSC